MFLSVSKVELNDDKDLPQQSTSKGTKRKKAEADQQKTKIPKAEGSMTATSKNGSGSENCKSGGLDVDKLLEEQTKALWTIKDDLKKHVTTAEMREMLEANGQDTTGSEFDLRDRWYVPQNSYISMHCIITFFFPNYWTVNKSVNHFSSKAVRCKHFYYSRMINLYDEEF